MIKGRVHSLESFGSVDGPGIRYLIFLQGCPMRCRYCHNADTWDFKKGDEYTADELLDKAERYRSYWGDRGGITVSGGEPLMRKKDLIRICEKHDDCIFLTFTNGTLIDEAFADEMLRVKNFVPAISLEGFGSRSGNHRQRRISHVDAQLY